MTKPLTDEQIINLKNQAWFSLDGQNLTQRERRVCRVVLRLGRELLAARHATAAGEDKGAG